MTTDLLWQYLLQGDILGFVQAVFTSVLGDLFYGFIMLIVLVPLYIRTQSLLAVMVVTLLLSGLFYSLTPVGGIGLMRILLTVALGGLLFWLFTKVMR